MGFQGKAVSFESLGLPGSMKPMPFWYPPLVFTRIARRTVCGPSKANAVLLLFGFGWGGGRGR